MWKIKMFGSRIKLTFQIDTVYLNTCLIFHVYIISTRTKIIHILRIILKGLCTIQCIFASFIAFVHINMHKANFFLKYIYKK